MSFFGIHRTPIWREYDQIRKEMDRLSGLFSQAGRWGAAPFARGALFPLLNVTESPTDFVITAEIPGVKSEDLDIKVEGNTVTLRGERKPDDLGEGGSYHRRERTTGSFQRCLTLPAKIDADKVKATYGKGVLTLTLPKPEEVQPRQICVECD
jgi:HSP20 family protein